jgi:hypothetical protein
MPNENLDRLEQEVSRDTDVTSSATTLLNGLSAELQAIKDELAAQNVDNARLNTLVDSVASNTTALADAVAANTPADPNA